MKDPVSAKDGGQANEPSKEQAPDLASIRVQVGDGPDSEMSVKDLLERAYPEARKEMHQAIQEKHALKNQYKWADIFRQDLENDPGLRSHIEAYYAPRDESGNPYPQQRTYSHHVPSPEKIRLDQVETRLHVLSQKEAIATLKHDLKESFGYNLTDKQQAAILETIAETSNENVNDIFWGKFGKDVVKSSSSRQKKEVQEKLKENAAAYTGSPTGPVEIPDADVASMDEAEYEAHKEKVIADILRKGGG